MLYCNSFAKKLIQNVFKNDNYEFLKKCFDCNKIAKRINEIMYNQSECSKKGQNILSAMNQKNICIESLVVEKSYDKASKLTFVSECTGKEKLINKYGKEIFIKQNNCEYFYDNKGILFAVFSETEQVLYKSNEKIINNVAGIAYKKADGLIKVIDEKILLKKMIDKPLPKSICNYYNAQNKGVNPFENFSKINKAIYKYKLAEDIRDITFKYIKEII